jgi:N-acetyl-anhydromuramyl-L-alanine amidase AmpD
MTELRNKRCALMLAACITGLVACAGFVDVASQNQNSRVNYLVIHHTSEDFAESLRLLTQPSDNPVSVHYLIPEPNDATYERRDLEIHRLVSEDRRAWHAGHSYWHEEDALNDRSIGIELVNKTYCNKIDPDRTEPAVDNQVCYPLPYPDEQIALLINLSQDILSRYPEIDPVDVVGHADIAPDRRVDPGPLFPWKLLFDVGIGAWYDDQTLLKYAEQFSERSPPIETVQQALRDYGYRVIQTGLADDQTKLVVRAFQMHFRPAGISGDIDAETTAILFALLEKYRPASLNGLLEQNIAER